MTAPATDWLELLADWSLRWGVVILGLMIVLTVGRPRSVAVRLWLARLSLVGGLLLPLSPTWWTVQLPAIVPAAPVADRGAGENDRSSSPEVGRPVPEAQEAAGFDPRTVNPAVSPRPGETGPPPPSVVPWPVVLAGAWLIGCVFSLLRLAAGRRWLARARAAAAPVTGKLLDEFAAVRDELGVRRPVVFLVSPAVAGPALFGGRRPAVVVPPDWAAFPAADRRAVLLHELAHVAHGDDWSALGEEVVRAVFFFHPLVRWLVGRLAHEREHRCDATAVRRNVDPIHLARVLLDSAKRLGPGRSVLAPAGAVPMFHRNAVKDRIHQLLEADMTRWSKPLSPARAALAAVAVFGCCAGLAGLGAKAGPPADPPPAAPEPAPPDRKAAPEVQGTVTGPDGKPVAGATVLIVGDAGRGERLTTTSDADGRFSFARVPVGKIANSPVALIAVRDGYAAPHAPWWAPAQLGSVRLELSAPAKYSGTVKDAAGRPVAGAEVEAGYILQYESPPWFDVLQGYVPPAVVRGTPTERFYLAKTDAAGRFEFPALPAGKGRIFRVTARGFAELDTGAAGSPAELVLRPEAVIRGRVVSRVPGVKPDAATVLVEGRDIAGLSRTIQPDADGRFTVAGLPAGTIGVGVELPPGVPATARDALVKTEPGAEKEIVLEVISGVEVSGRVRTKESGEPASGATVWAIRSVHPHRDPGMGPTTADGRFTLRLPPGPVKMYAYIPWSAGPPGAQSPMRDIDIPAGATRHVIAEPFELVRTPTPPSLPGKR